MFRLFLILFNLSYSINAFLLVAGTRRVVKQLSVTNGGPYGTWNTAEFCPVGYFAVGFNVKVEPKSSAGIFADNTALNSILLRCQDGTSITSGEGAFGHWQAEAGCGYNKDGNPNFLTSFDLQVEPDQGIKDDSSANWIRFKCRAFDTENSHQLDVPPGKFYWGTYGSWSEACPLHSAICGIQTRVEKERSSLYGNTALNDAILFCCNE